MGEHSCFKYFYQGSKQVTEALRKSCELKEEMIKAVKGWGGRCWGCMTRQWERARSALWCLSSYSHQEHFEKKWNTHILWTHYTCVCYFWVIPGGITLSLPYLHAVQPYSQHQPPEGGQQSSDPAADCPQYLTSTEHTRTHALFPIIKNHTLTFCPRLHILHDILHISRTRLVCQTDTDKLMNCNLFLLFFKGKGKWSLQWSKAPAMPAANETKSAGALWCLLTGTTTETPAWTQRRLKGN